MKRRLEPAFGKTAAAPQAQANSEPEGGEGLMAVAKAAIAQRREAGDPRRSQTEAAFRALLQAEPCLPVERAKAIIESALAGTHPPAPARATASTTRRAPGRRWLLPTVLLALISLLIAVPLALAWLPFALDPAEADPISALTARLALALPATLLALPLLAWSTAAWRRPALTRTLCLLPLLHIAALAGSLALP